jgi:hypothetical protein
MPANPTQEKSECIMQTETIPTAVKDLRAIARGQGIKGYSRLKRSALIAAIAAATPAPAVETATITLPSVEGRAQCEDILRAVQSVHGVSAARTLRKAYKTVCIREERPTDKGGSRSVILYGTCTADLEGVDDYDGTAADVQATVNAAAANADNMDARKAARALGSVSHWSEGLGASVARAGAVAEEERITEVQTRAMARGQRKGARTLRRRNGRTS